MRQALRLGQVTLAAPESLLGPFAFGDVLSRPEQPDNVACLIARRVTDLADDLGLLREGDDAIFDVERCAFEPRSSVRPENVELIIGMDAAQERIVAPAEVAVADLEDPILRTAEILPTLLHLIKERFTKYFFVPLRILVSL